MTHTFSLYTIGQAHGGVTIPLHDGVAAMEGGNAVVAARADNAFPYGQDTDGGPLFPKDMDRLVDRFYPFLDNARFRVDRLKHYAVPLYDVTTVRSLTANAPTGSWLDKPPFRVLLAEGDHLTRVFYDDVPYILIVRDGVVMAGIQEDSWPQQLQDAGHCDPEVVAFERMMELDQSLHADPLQQAFDYAGRVYDRSTLDGRAKAGALLKKLRPIPAFYDEAGRKRL